MDSVIEAAHYGEEAERLAASPAIIAMFDELPEEFRDDKTMNSWSFIRQSGDEAQKRGVQVDSIGGAARALRLIRDRRKPKAA